MENNKQQSIQSNQPAEQNKSIQNNSKSNITPKLSQTLQQSQSVENFCIAQKFSVSKYYQVKKDKKEVCTKQQTLENRVKKLILDEESAKRKIDDTEKRIVEIYAIKKKQATKRAEQQRKLVEVDEIPFTHPTGQLLLKKAEAAKLKIYNKNKEQAAKIRNWLESSKKHLLNDCQVQLANNAWKAKQFKEVQKRNKVFLKSLEFTKQQSVGQEMIFNTYQALEEIEKKQKNLKGLEQKEQNILNNLKKTRQRQQQVNEQYQFCIKHRAKEFEEKYIQQTDAKSNSQQNQECDMQSSANQSSIKQTK